MDTAAVLMSALTGAVALAVLGGVGGGIAGIVSEKKKLTQMEAVQMALPEHVAAVPEFASAFLTFAKDPRANVEALQRCTAGAAACCRCTSASRRQTPPLSPCG